MSTNLSQHEFWQQESWEYFERNYGGKDLREVPPAAYLGKMLTDTPTKMEGCSVLDIGCGAASNLHYLVQQLGGRRGVGMETAPQTVAELTKAFPEYEFLVSDSATLPFETGEFDWVVITGVMCWVDRNYMLQTLGEALRVCSSHFLIRDFAPYHRYSTAYKHCSGYRTYKMGYRSLVEASGFMQPIYSFKEFEDDDWNTRELTLYKKIDLDRAFPLRVPDEFV